MTTLEQYHTIKCNPTFYWENNEVAVKLRNLTITTYEQYVRACKAAGCAVYRESLFDEHMREIFALKNKTNESLHSGK